MCVRESVCVSDSVSVRERERLNVECVGGGRDEGGRIRSARSGGWHPRCVLATSDWIKDGWRVGWWVVDGVGWHVLSLLPATG